MWDELENYLPILICSYVIPFSFGDIASVQRYREKDYVLRFLKGFNKKLTHSKTYIMMMNLLPNIDREFFLVIQQEREPNISVPNTIPNVGNNEEVIAL